MDTLRTVDEGHRELASSLEQRGVDYVFASFIDVMGRAKSKCVPVAHLPELLAGHERYTPRGLGGLGKMTPNEDECVTIPDASTLTILPFAPRFAHMVADLYYGGNEPFALCTRSILKRQIAAAAAEGYMMNLGVETELYFIRPPEDGHVTPGGTEAGGYLEPLAPSGKLRPTPAYDVESTLDSFAFLDPMVKAMSETGFGLFSFDHEGGDGQVEFDFDYASALEMADRLTLFRLMAKQVAKDAGLLATFMPKPYTSSWGSGAHFNMSLADLESGNNLFRDAEDPRGKGWSKKAYGFVAGILRHAPALSAICTPTVNSYKRLQPRLADGTVSWAPVYPTYGDNNRSCMLRLPHNRPAVENRVVDAAANPYLAAAFLLAAGLEGIREGLDPGEPVGELTYDWSTSEAPTKRLPRTLLEAVEAFEADPLTRAVFSEQFVSSYAAMKLDEWNSYHGIVSDWERTTYLRALLRGEHSRRAVVADRPLRWSELAWPEIQALIAARPLEVGLVPVGATEQHGPHLPTGTDTILASAICDGASAATGAPVLPPIAVGCSFGHGTVIPGTLSLTPEELTATIGAVATWAAYSKLRRLLFVNGHFGNAGALLVATDHLRHARHDLRAGFFGWWEAGGELAAEVFSDGEDVHANRAETSLMLAVAPELVHLERLASSDDPDRTTGLVFRYTATELSANGVTGAPSLASVELGRRLLAGAVSAVAGRVERGRAESVPLPGGPEIAPAGAILLEGRP